MNTQEIRNQLEQSKEKLIAIAEENLKIFYKGSYLVGNKKVDMSEDIAFSVNRTKTYSQDKNPPVQHKTFELEQVEVRNETTLSGALYLKDRNPVVLNMASATSCWQRAGHGRVVTS